MTATFVKVLLAITALTAAACGVSPAPEHDASGANSAEYGTLPPVELPTATIPTPGAATTGMIERAAVTAPGYVAISGSAHGSEPNAPVTLTASIDGARAGTMLTTDPATSSFVVDLAVPEGDHVVCITSAIAAPEPLDCFDLHTDPAVEIVEDGTVLLTAVDPDPTGTVTVRGVVVGSGNPAGIDVTTDTATTQVPVDSGTFRFELHALADGTYRLCPNPTGLTITANPTDTSTTCGTAIIGPLSIGTTGRATGVDEVAPEIDHPLYRMERDGGISVELTDGSTLWFFGDTMERRSDDLPRYFINNTAAWASADAPTVTRDVVATKPVLFAAPPAGICDASRLSPALWPESAVAIPQDDGTDRVVVVMSKVCLGDGWLDIESIGFVVVEYRYDPANPPIDQPIRGEVTQPHLAAADAGYGRALLLDTDGFLYGYECGTYPEPWETCGVARVRPEQVTNPAAWRYWNGGDWTDPSNWVSDEAAAGAMELPGDVATALPIAAFGVTYHEGYDTHLMVYSPWPGFCDLLAVRASDTPVGPWTDAVEIAFPNCSGTARELDEHCYAATPQPQLCELGTFAGGYYDLDTEIGVGRYYTFATPFVVVHDR